MALPRARGPLLVAVLILTVVLGSILRHAERRPAKHSDASPSSSGLRLDSAPATAQTSAEPPRPADAPLSAEAEAPTVAAAEATSTAPAPVTTTPLATATVSARPDLAGTWRGTYIDASGKELLRVVSLSISRVDDAGGIEGTLQYDAASGNGECKLHPHGSNYWRGEQRLQLSPEGCGPHYPKELGVPVDFDGVSPQTDTLRNGRVAAPTGEVIKVKLKRVSGV
jgi:hypothetical protein